KLTMNLNRSRRQFLKSSSLAGMGAMLAIHSPSNASDKGEKAKRTCSGAQLGGGLSQLGGVSLQALLDYHRRYLTDTYIPNWDRAVNEQYGGFANVGVPGRDLNFSKKGMSSPGRAIWMFSYLYNHVTHDNHHFEAVIQGRYFVVKHALMDGHQWAL